VVTSLIDFSFVANYMSIFLIRAVPDT